MAWHQRSGAFALVFFHVHLVDVLSNVVTGVASPTQSPRSATGRYMTSLRASHTNQAVLTSVLGSLTAITAFYYKCWPPAVAYTRSFT